MNILKSFQSHGPSLLRVGGLPALCRHAEYLCMLYSCAHDPRCSVSPYVRLAWDPPPAKDPASRGGKLAKN